MLKDHFDFSWHFACKIMTHRCDLKKMSCIIKRIHYNNLLSDSVPCRRIQGGGAFNRVLYWSRYSISGIGDSIFPCQSWHSNLCLTDWLPHVEYSHAFNSQVMWYKLELILYFPKYTGEDEYMTNNVGMYHGGKVLQSQCFPQTRWLNSTCEHALSHGDSRQGTSCRFSTCLRLI